MTPVFYTAVEIAELLKISKSLAYRLIAQGEMPAIRFGRTVRVRQEDLELFITGNMFASNALSQRKYDGISQQKDGALSNLEI